MWAHNSAADNCWLYWLLLTTSSAATEIRLRELDFYTKIIESNAKNFGYSEQMLKFCKFVVPNS